VEYHALAILVRDVLSMPPDCPESRRRLAARVRTLGLPPDVATDVQYLWTEQGWARPERLQADAAVDDIWTS
jgi:hypothetical protein